jgi:hypothetical protein
MKDTLQWHIRGESFEDGSKLDNWRKVDESDTWMWQYDTHELSFVIYEHDGQYWKLYRARFAQEDGAGYSFEFGGQACRMVQVRYCRRAKSPHSSLLMDEGAVEWVRTYEVDETIHEVLKAGQADPQYGASYGPKQAA